MSCFDVKRERVGKTENYTERKRQTDTSDSLIEPPLSKMSSLQISHEQCFYITHKQN